MATRATPAELRSAERGIAAAALTWKLPFGPSDLTVAPNGLYGPFKSAQALADAALSKYGQVYTSVYEEAAEALRRGYDQVPTGISEALHVGNRADAAARKAMRSWLQSIGVEEGPAGVIRVNRRLYDQGGASLDVESGPRRYRVPDVHVRRCGLEMTRMFNHGVTHFEAYVDFISAVLIADRFHPEEWVPPGEQLNLDRAFALLRDELHLVAGRMRNPAIEPALRDLLARSLAAYYSPEPRDGARLLQEFEALILSNAKHRG